MKKSGEIHVTYWPNDGKAEFRPFIPCGPLDYQKW